MFQRLELLVGNENLKKIANKKILIVGIGGVGGACLEALVRSGFQNITIIDNDTFDKTNLNRQILSTQNNINNKKVLEGILRAKSINPNIYINYYEIFLNEANFDEIHIDKYDYVVDACDTTKTKILLIKECLKNNIKIISSMGTGNRLDPTKLQITSIWKTSYDPLAKLIRKELRKLNIKNNIPVVTSSEQPIKTNSTTIASSTFVPNVAGFYIASYIFNDIIK